MSCDVTHLTTPIMDFLKLRTPQAWVEQAVSHLDDLLIDHANCEKKAASTALSLMYRYVEYPALLQRLSRLAREELRHFEQVLCILQNRNIPYKTLTASRYANTLRQAVRTHEPAKLIDLLIIAAIIEARSCERFACLCPYLDTELSKFYRGLLASEARHFQTYINYAEHFAGETLPARVAYFIAIDHELITSPDVQFRFHSGPVTSAG